MPISPLQNLSQYVQVKQSLIQIKHSILPSEAEARQRDIEEREKQRLKQEKKAEKERRRKEAEARRTQVSLSTFEGAFLTYISCQVKSLFWIFLLLSKNLSSHFKNNINIYIQSAVL